MPVPQVVRDLMGPHGVAALPAYGDAVLREMEEVLGGHGATGATGKGAVGGTRLGSSGDPVPAAAARAAADATATRRGRTRRGQAGRDTGAGREASEWGAGRNEDLIALRHGSEGSSAGPCYYLIKLVTRYQHTIAWVLSWPFKPLIWATEYAWILFLHAYVHVLQVCGIIALCGLVLLAFYWFRQQVQDPYDIEGSVRKLRKVANLVGLTLKDAERSHIGEYPLGGEIEDQPHNEPASDNGSAAPP
ncbi:hypothetical protein LTR91_019978 [Friedmanniomyces endolithicus]|uniref:Uncharacterized protein n=1 Tax=Friedmanniomyces endolithicus TaxID=329885 RepID=A0AAN6HA59_9PEZI|nr:hypothetical protein LTR57_015601 [Friedmanniomyces endolithicus]KAK0961249.1 hypothetical protein LTR91_019978 [Friedmanniomyces endolithicus]KAK1029201.1 hypothetical protein LTS16_019956 [Friedmanniomyces endolithicus]